MQVPGLGKMSWVSDIFEERENEYFAWRTVGETVFDHEGRVTFKPAPNNLGTEVTLKIDSRLSGGRITNTLAWLLRRSPEDYVVHTLRNFKQLMETGEVATNKGPSGRARIMTGIGPKAAVGMAAAVFFTLLYVRSKGAAGT